MGHEPIERMLDIGSRDLEDGPGLTLGEHIQERNDNINSPRPSPSLSKFGDNLSINPKKPKKNSGTVSQAMELDSPSSINFKLMAPDNGKPFTESLGTGANSVERMKKGCSQGSLGNRHCTTGN